MLRFTRYIIRQPLFQIDQPFQQGVMVIGGGGRRINFGAPPGLGRPAAQAGVDFIGGMPLAQPVIINQPEAVAALAYQLTVMTDQQQTTGILAQRGSQRLFAFHIQMVGGLIQQKQAIARQRQPDKQQSGTFTPAEGADLLPVTAPAETGGNQRPLTALCGGFEALQRLQQRGVIRQLTQRLVVVARM
ncbi:Uncharacterised protein [Raoultella planticola]|uniref:Uncharacterized protein n=1 Tax=Raoultella planticola TaxID=575 RepID=A0A485CVK7_RAOPL|nr:Uncharacterised protein [Raoultella planticola]